MVTTWSLVLGFLGLIDHPPSRWKGSSIYTVGFCWIRLQSFHLFEHLRFGAKHPDLNWQNSRLSRIPWSLSTMLTIIFSTRSGGQNSARLEWSSLASARCWRPHVNTPREHTKCRGLQTLLSCVRTLPTTDRGRPCKKLERYGRTSSSIALTPVPKPGDACIPHPY